MKQTNTHAYKTHREELRSALQKAFFDNLTRLGNDAKDLDFFAGNKEKQSTKKAA
jgi:hypothetical protein